jgi:hypothetical protein
MKGDFYDLVDRARIDIITVAIVEAKGNASQAAQNLGIESRQFYTYVKKLGLAQFLIDTRRRYSDTASDGKRETTRTAALRGERSQTVDR